MVGGDDSGGEAVLAREAEQRAAISEAALGRYAQRVRRQRLIYFPVVFGLLLALVVTFSVAYLHGEAHNTRSITVAKAPGALAVRAPSPDQRELWHTSDRAAIGTPNYAGTVVVWAGHTVRGIDARTGKQTWSYYRSDRTVCSAAQINGIAVAVYELSGNCDEVTGLDAGTGVLQWTRTLDFDGQPLFGHPQFSADEYDSSLMITSPTVIYTLGVGSGESGGEDHFIYSHFGCVIDGAAIGLSGGLIHQTCVRPRCGTGTSVQKFCGTGPQLLLRPQYDPGTDAAATNPNRITWSKMGNADVPLSAGTIVAAGDKTNGDLDIFDPQNGKPAGSVPLGIKPVDWQDATSTPLGDDGALVWADGMLNAVVYGSSDTTWTATSLGPPSISHGSATQVTSFGVRLLQSQTGTVQQSYPLTPAPPAGSTVYRLGAGFVVTSTSGTTAFG